MAFLYIKNSLFACISIGRDLKPPQKDSSSDPSYKSLISNTPLWLRGYVVGGENHMGDCKPDEYQTARMAARMAARVTVMRI